MTLQLESSAAGARTATTWKPTHRTAVAGLGIEARSSTGDRADYARYGVLYTPGLVINDKLASGGRVPSVAKITTLLTNVLADEG